MSIPTITKENYIEIIKTHGINVVWNHILSNYNSIKSNFINIDNFHNLYEIALSTNSIHKKQNGQFFTPKLTAELTADFLSDYEAENVCDVACSTGTLILEYFEKIGEEKTKELLKQKRVFLYDADKTALNICTFIICHKYGYEYKDNITVVNADFLDKNITLPKNSKVISNPPYFQLKTFKDNWDVTNSFKAGKELYVAFMEKIIKQSSYAVLITPWTFLCAEKFFPFRRFLNDYYTEVYCFDNIPCGIFGGKLYDDETSLKPNQIRASITVVDKNKDAGIYTTDLIRFSPIEKENILQKDFLKTRLNPQKQIIDETITKIYKCSPELNNLLHNWINNSTHTLNDLISEKETDYKLTVPNMCRYYMCGAKGELKRTGKFEFYLKDYKSFVFAYALFNSSFAYWYWRLYDGGINFQKSLMKTIPVFNEKIDEETFTDLEKIVNRLISEESKNKTIKTNAGKPQENIKIPNKYREKINDIFCKILNTPTNLSYIHKNTYF